MFDDNDIQGVVNQKVAVREGKNYEDVDVVELRFTFISNPHNQQTSIVVIERDTAKDLAYLLLNMFLYREDED